MKAAARFEIDTSEFMGALRNFQSTSKKSVAENLKNQGRLLATAIMQLTPPNKEKPNKEGGFTPSWNKKGGEQTVQNDLAKIFRQSTKGIADPSALHKRFRRGRGRVFTRLKTETKDSRIRVANLVQYRKTIKARVGYMAAGWSAAAKALAAKVPEWISRHRASGKGGIKVLGSRIEVELTNNAIYPKSRNLIERRVKSALTYRAKTMMKQVNKSLASSAKESGFQAGGS